MQPTKVKLVYPHFINCLNKQVPVPNGLHPKVVKWMLDYAQEHPNLVADYNCDRIHELDNTYLLPDSGVLFHHINIAQYFRKFYGDDSVVSLDQVKADDGIIYFMPYELDRGNIEYIYNPTKFKINGEEVEYHFADTIPAEAMPFLQSGKIRLLLASLTEFTHGRDTLVRLENVCMKLGIPPKYLNYVMGNTTRDYVGDVVQVASHASLVQQVEIGRRYPIERSSLGYLCDYPKVHELDSTKIRPKRFLCWNRTMNRPHRLGIAYLALKHDLLKDSLFSFLHGLQDHMAEEDLTGLVNEPKEVISDYIARIKAMIPYEIDTQTLNEEGKQGFQSNENNKKEFYADTYLHITSETLFNRYGTPFMSEKTFRPILNLQPFIYIGNYKGLEELHRLGFKTFDGYIDESYDQEPDPKKRLAMIETEIVRFAKMSMEELHNWYYSLVDILIYNQQHFLSLKDLNPIEDFVNRYKDGI